jgi:hypothetical protein
MSSWQAKARKRWGRKADWIQGDGPFAVLAPCRVLTVTLWDTRAGAEEAKKSIDKAGCGGKCNPRQHKIIDMSLSVGRPVGVLEVGRFKAPHHLTVQPPPDVECHRAGRRPIKEARTGLTCHEGDASRTRGHRPVRPIVHFPFGPRVSTVSGRQRWAPAPPRTRLYSPVPRSWHWVFIDADYGRVE